MSDLEDVKEDLERICAEGDVLCCAALKCIRELEAAQGEGMYGEYTPITVRSDTAPVTVSEAARERVARAIANAREGGWPADTYAMLQQHYLTMADAALRAIAGQGGEA